MHTLTHTHIQCICDFLYIIYIYMYTHTHIYIHCGPELSGRSGDRIPRFSAPVRTGPGAHPASYTVGTGSFPRINQLGRGLDVRVKSARSQFLKKAFLKIQIFLKIAPFWVSKGYRCFEGKNATMLVA
jgi:hypothetical protein